jgi:hypothetical protein
MAPSRPLPLTRLVPLFMLIGSACRGDQGDQPEQALAAATARWCTPGSPLITVGRGDGVSEDLLHAVVGAHRFADGRLVVASAGTPALRYFEADGHLATSVGRQGDGPGEFRNLVLLRPLEGDSLLTFDATQQRATIFDASGAVARTFRMPQVEGFPIMTDARRDGTSLVRIVQPFRSDELNTGVRRPDVSLLLLDAAGEVRGTLGAFPGEAGFSVEVGDGMVAGPLALGPGLHAALTPSAAAVAVGDADSVSLLRDSGAVGLALDFPRLRAEPADFDFVMAAYLEQVPVAGRQIEGSRFRTMPRVDSLPLVAQLATDPRGRIWVRQYLHPADSRRVWTVFSESGDLTAHARTPDGADVVEIGDGYVLVLTRDEFGVESVAVVPLRTQGCP